MIENLARKYGVPFYYCNAVGGNDQLVFDGHSLAVSGRGKTFWRGAFFTEELSVIDESDLQEGLKPVRSEMADLYDALVLGLRITWKMRF